MLYRQQHPYEALHTASRFPTGETHSSAFCYLVINR